MVIANYIKAIFEVDIPKSAKTLAKFVSKDPCRPEIIGYVAMRPGQGYMAATDERFLRVINIKPQGNFPKDITVYINPAHVAKIAGKKAVITAAEAGETHCTRIDCEGETFFTENTSFLFFPDVLRAIPRSGCARSIELTPEGLDGLKKFLKINSECSSIAVKATAGSDVLIVCTQVDTRDYNRSHITLKLAAPSEGFVTMGFNPKRLATALTGSNGKLEIYDYPRPTKIYGEADETILMPTEDDSETTEYLYRITRLRLAPSAFTVDAAKVIATLQKAARRYWDYVVRCYTHNGKCDLTPGNYSAAEVAKGKPGGGNMVFPSEGYEEPLTITRGNISLSVEYRNIFAVLSQWEKLSRNKAVFSVSDVKKVNTSDMQNNKLTQQPATPSEAPQISTENAERLNESEEDRNAVESPETSQTVECTSEPPKEPQRARMEPRRAVWAFRTTQPRTCKEFLMVGYAPRYASAHHIRGTTKMVFTPSGYAPPIRGSCGLRRLRRAQPPNSTKTYQISSFKPP